MSKSTEETLRDKITIIKANSLYSGLSLADIQKIPKPYLEKLEAETDALLQLFDQELAKRVEEALISTGLYLRCDFCGQVKEAGKSRHTYDSEGKPIEHICNDCVNATLNNQEKK